MPHFRRTALAAAAFLLSACGREAAPDEPMTPEQRGRAAFAECAVCHSKEDPVSDGYVALVGPSLFRVYGAKSARVADYDYSAAMREADLLWDEATLDVFIENPHKLIPKTRMSYVGMADGEKRAALIAYLKTLK
jgi:cytochrome c